MVSAQNTSSLFLGRGNEHVTRLTVSKDMWVNWLFSGVLAATSPARCAVAVTIVNLILALRCGIAGQNWRGNPIVKDGVLMNREEDFHSLRDILLVILEDESMTNVKMTPKALLVASKLVRRNAGHVGGFRAKILERTHKLNPCTNLGQ